MNISQPAFQFGSASTVNLAASGSSSRVRVQSDNIASRHVRVFNSGTDTAFIECGPVTVAAAVATGYPIAPGTIEIIACPHAYIAAITAGGTPTLYFTPGEGL